MSAVSLLRPSLAITLLRNFPRALQSEIIDNAEFRRRCNVTLEAVVTIGDDVASVQRSALFGAIRQAHTHRGQTFEVRDEQGRAWQLSVEQHGAASYVAFRRGQQTALLPPFYALDGNAERRLAAFIEAARDVNLPAERVKHWKRVLRRRTLQDEEVGDLDGDLAHTPISTMQAIADDITSGFSKLDRLVPSTRAYLERLIGADCLAETIEVYARGSIARHVAQLISWAPWRGAQLALLLAGHSSVISAIDEATLDKVDMLELAEWARDYGDPLSQLGMVEIGVRRLARQPEIEPTLVAIVQRLLAEDAADEAGRLALLSATFIFVDGELARTQVLRGDRPFRRRLAALAQASLIHRQIWGTVDTARFSRWSMEQRGYDFFCRTLVDLRAEPRWMPYLASAEQFGHEVLGRLASLRGVNDGLLPPGPLRDLLMSDGEDALKSRLSLMAFWPGPLEGHQPGSAIPVPPEIGEIIVESLSVLELEPKAFFALINARGFVLNAEFIDLAIRSLQDAKYRLKEEPDTLSLIYFGLASVAAEQRRPDLARELCILVRRGRRDHAKPMSGLDELRVAMTAAAAHEGVEDWSTFAGDWALELALGGMVSEQARILLIELDHLIRLAPELARGMAPARAALSAVIDL